MANVVELKFKLAPVLDEAAMAKVEKDLLNTSISMPVVDGDLAAREVGKITAAAEEAQSAMEGTAGAVEEVGKGAAKIESPFARMEQEADDAKKRVKALEGALRDVVAGGTTEGSEFDKLKADLDAARQSAKKAEDAIAEVETAIGNVAKEAEGGGDALTQMFALEAMSHAGEQLNSIAEAGIHARDSMAQVAAMTGKTGEELERIQVAGEEAFIRGVGENVGEATKAIARAEQVLGKFLDPKGIQDFVEISAGISQIYGTDLQEQIGKTRTFIAQFNKDAISGGNLIALAMQQAATGQDDVIDTLDEYSQHAAKAGYSAEQFLGTLTTGTQLGIRDTDKLGDAIKETQIRLAAGDTANALADISSPITKSIQEITEAGKRGEISVREVLQKSATIVKDAFDAGTINKSVRDQFNTAISGTMAEDIGGELYSKIFSTEIDESVITENAKKAGAAVSNALGPVTVFEKLEKQVTVYGEKASQALAPVVGSAGKLLSIGAQLGSGVKGFQTIIPEGAAGKAIDFAKSIIGKVVPSLAVQTASTGVATTATATLNTTMLANPALLVAAGVAALVTGLHFLSDALHDTAEEQLGEQESLTGVLEQQKQAAQARYDQAAAVNNNVEKLKLLHQAEDDARVKAEASGQSQAQQKASADRLASAHAALRDVTVDLTAQYPKGVSAGKSYEENLRAVEQAAKDNVTEIIKAGAEVANFSKQVAASQNAELNLKVAVQAEDIENQLTDALDKGFASGFEAFSKGDVLAGLDATFLAGFGGEISEFIFGTSFSRKGAEKITEGFKNDIFNAKNADDVAKAQSKFIAAIAVDGEKMGISKEEQLKIIQSVKATGDARVKQLEQSQKNEQAVTAETAETITRTLSDAAKGGGASLAQTAEAMTGAFGMTKEAILRTGLNTELDKAAKSGKLTDAQIVEMAKKYGLSADEARKHVEQQKKMEEAQKTVNLSVADLAAKWGQVQAAAEAAQGNGLAALNQLRLDIKAANDRGDKEEAARLTERYNKELAATKKAVKDKVALERQAAAIAIATGATVTDFKQQQLTLTREIDEINASLQEKLIKDVEAQQRISLERQQALELRAVDDQIVEINKRKQKSEILPGQAEDLIKLANQKRLALEKKHQKELLDLALEPRRIAYDRSVAAAQAAADRNVAIAQNEVTRIAAISVSSADEEIDRVQTLTQARLKAAQLETDAAIEAAINGNIAVVKAKEALRDAVAKQDVQAARIAEEQIESARADAIAGDPSVIRARLEQEAKLKEVATANLTDVQEVAIAGITDRYERQRQIAITEAARVRDAEILAAKGNEDLMLQAHVKFNAARLAADEQYARDSSAVIAAIDDFKTNLLNSFNDDAIKALRDQRAAEAEASAQRIADLEKERAAILKNFEATELSYEEYQQQIKDLTDKANEAAAEEAKKTAEAEVAARKATMDSISASLRATSDQQIGYATELAKAGTIAYEQMGLAASTSFLSMVSSGESAKASILLSLLDMAQKAIIIYSKQIIALFTASIPPPFGTIAGIAAAGVAIAGIQAAKAEIGLHRGYDGKGPIQGTPSSKDTVHVLMTPNERMVPEPLVHKYGTTLDMIFADKDPADHYRAEALRSVMPAVDQILRITKIHTDRIERMESVQSQREIRERTRIEQRTMTTTVQVINVDNSALENKIEHLANTIERDTRRQSGRPIKADVNVNGTTKITRGDIIQSIEASRIRMKGVT
jgi:predicted  nucleic acid-binding Zn-ribbon protein